MSGATRDNPAPEQADPINSPAHYTRYPVQPIEISRHLGFCLGNVVKFVLRAPYKGGVEDCDKALRYLEWEKEFPQEIVLSEALRAVAMIEELSDYLHGLPSTPWMEALTEPQADCLDFLQGYLESGSRKNLDSVGFYINGLAVALEMEHCRVCGCIDSHACEGGCHWVEVDLCSACVGKEKEAQS